MSSDEDNNVRSEIHGHWQWSAQLFNVMSSGWLKLQSLDANANPCIEMYIYYQFIILEDGVYYGSIIIDFNYAIP